MTSFIIAQICLFLGATLMVASGLPKQKRQILLLQDLQLAFLTVGVGLLGSIAGAATNILSIFRNKLYQRGYMSHTIQIVYILATICIVLPLNNLGWVGLLPIAATCAFTAAINCKNIVTYKCVFISTCIMWLIHDIYIQAWATILFDILGIITNTIAICQGATESSPMK